MTDETIGEIQPSYKDPKKYLWSISTFLTLVPVFSIWLYGQTNSEWALWFSFGFFYIAVPCIEMLFGTDPSNPPREAIGPLSRDKYYSRIIYLSIPFIYGSWIYGGYFLANETLQSETLNRESLGLNGYVALTVGVGMMLGGSLNAGHETGHRKGAVAGFFTRLFLSVSLMGHFRIEHNLGHHAQVATEKDSATSRMGENFYAFTLRELPGGYLRAWRIEKARLNRLGKSAFNPGNELLQNWTLTVLFYAAFVVGLGWIILPYLLGAGLFANLMLSSANYIEHYGLIRTRQADGKYEKVQPRHSWNANHIVSNVLLLHLQRHSDHHAHAGRPYQCLRHFDQSPQMPYGYFTMYLLAWMPFLWFRIVDPLLARQLDFDMNKAYIKDSYKAYAFEKYHHPETIQARAG